MHEGGRQERERLKRERDAAMANVRDDGLKAGDP